MQALAHHADGVRGPRHIAFVFAQRIAQILSFEGFDGETLGLREGPVEIQRRKSGRTRIAPELEIVFRNLAARREDRCPLEHIAELSNIPGQIVTHESLKDTRRNLRRREPHLR